MAAFPIEVTRLAQSAGSVERKRSVILKVLVHLIPAASNETLLASRSVGAHLPKAAADFCVVAGLLTGHNHNNRSD
jgi:hypothetical protein